MFISTSTAQRVKFDPRARFCVFRGYPTDIKGYKLYDIQTKQIFMSRDVIFLEEIFPFDSITPQEHLIDPFPQLVLPILADDIKLPSSVSPAIDDSHIPPPPQTHQLLYIRRCTRPIKTPSYLRDFPCDLLTHHSNSKILYPLCESVSYDSLSSSHKNFVMDVSSNYEPQFHHQALPFQHWRDAMQDDCEQWKPIRPGLLFPCH